MRLIDADALSKFIDCGHFNNPNEKLYSENDIEEMIFLMPTIDAAPVKHGKWVRNDYGDIGNYHCSECGKICMCNGDYAYCPNCGARIDEE